MAKLEIKNTNITIAGNWNVAILTPQWIQTQFPTFNTEKNIPIEIGINIRDIRYEIQNLIINPRPDKLIVSPKFETKECFNNLIKLTEGILKKLTHTPIQAVGTNHAYILDEKEKIGQIFNDSAKTDEFYSTIGKKYSGTSVIQHVLTESDKQITIYYNISSNAKMISFNYNRNTNNIDEVIKFAKDFKNHNSDTKNIIKNLLRK